MAIKFYNFSIKSALTVTAMKTPTTITMKMNSFPDVKLFKELQRYAAFNLFLLH